MIIQGLPTEARVWGQGQPVLLLHGWRASAELMQPVAERLAHKGFACHALDLPGFGQTATPPEAWDVAQYAAFVLAYLDSVGLERVHLIGHSFGGRISILLGAQHPQRVGKIVLTDSAGVKPLPTFKWRVYYALRRGIFGVLKLPPLRGFDAPLREWFWRRFGSDDARSARAENPVLFQTFQRVIGQDLVSFARKIQAPTLLIWGEKDADTPLQDAKILEAAIPDAGLVVIAGAGHYAYLEEPEYFVHVVAHFLGAED